MFSMIKSALATVFGSASLALGFDPNLANRYPAYADAGAYGSPRATFQSAPVRLREGRNATRTDGQESRSAIDSNDRASSPYGGGGF